MSVIEVKDLRFSYEKGQEVLRGINVSFKESTIYGILGRNGCGKSTFLDCLIGSNNYTGYVFVDCNDITKMPNRRISQLVSYIPQNTTVNMNYTVYEFLAFGRNPYIPLFGNMGSNDLAMIDLSVKECGIENILHKSITKISGGERQLVYICRALVQDTDIIIMDEPLSSLDYRNQLQVLALMKRLKERGKTIIFTTHNPQQIADFDCQIIAFRDGLVFDQRESNKVMDPKFINDVYEIVTE